MTIRAYVIGLVPKASESEVKRLIATADVAVIGYLTGRTFAIGERVTVEVVEVPASNGSDVGQPGEQYQVVAHEAGGRICILEKMAAS